MRGTRWIAVLATTALVTTAIGLSAGGALGGGGSGGVSNDELAQDFRSTTDGAATAFVAEMRQLQQKVGISAGNGTITAAEVGEENYRMLTSEIAALGDQFDAATNFPSEAYKLAIWAITMFAQQYDSNPRDIPISQGIAMVFVAAMLIFAPAAFKATGGTMYGPTDATASVDGIGVLTQPALQSFAAGNGPKSSQPLVSAADQQQIRDGLVAKGLAGPALDGVTRILTLAAALTIADARR